MNNLSRTGDPSHQEARSHSGTALAFLAMGLLLLLYMDFSLRNVSLDGDFHGWASASCMTMARAFVQLGALRTHFVPLQNNLPVGLDPDVYLHWPPLYPMLLGEFLRVFGDSPTSGRILGLLISLGSVTFLTLIAHRLFGLRVGLLAGFFYVTARATYESDRALIHQPLAMLFALAAVYCFVSFALGDPSAKWRSQRYFAVAGMGSMVLTVLTAWDPIFVPFGLLAAAVYLRHAEAIRLGAVYCVAAVLTFCVVQADYIASFPALFANQFATIAHRAGLSFNAGSSTRLHTLVDSSHFGNAAERLTVLRSYKQALQFVHIGFLVPELLCCLVFVILWARGESRRDVARSLLLGGLCLPVVVWYGLMRNYVAVHSFVLILASPFVAVATGYVLSTVWSWLEARAKAKPFLWLAVYVVPLLVLFPMFEYVRSARATLAAPEFTSMSQLLRAQTPADAVILTPVESLVPTYYSQRHLVRGIESDALLRRATEQAHAAFPGSPLFLAVQRGDRQDFPEALGGLISAGHLGDTDLYRLP